MIIIIVEASWLEKDKNSLIEGTVHSFYFTSGKSDSEVRPNHVACFVIVAAKPLIVLIDSSFF